MKTRLLKKDETIIRVLAEEEKAYLVIGCTKRSMPKWVDDLTGYIACTEDELYEQFGFIKLEIEKAEKQAAKVAHVIYHYHAVARLYGRFEALKQENKGSQRTRKNQRTDSKEVFMAVSGLPKYRGSCAPKIATPNLKHSHFFTAFHQMQQLEIKIQFQLEIKM